MENTHTNVEEIRKMQVRLSDWLVKHELIHRSLGFDCRGIETLQIKTEDCNSIAVISYVYGYNYLRPQCAYDVAPGGFLASVYHLTKIRYGIDKPEEVCIKVFAPDRIREQKKSVFNKHTSLLSFRNYYKYQLTQGLDYWGYRVISLGFTFLTIGILSGAVWANLTIF